MENGVAEDEANGQSGDELGNPEDSKEPRAPGKGRRVTARAKAKAKAKAAKKLAKAKAKAAAKAKAKAAAAAAKAKAKASAKAKAAAKAAAKKAKSKAKGKAAATKKAKGGACDDEVAGECSDAEQVGNKKRRGPKHKPAAAFGSGRNEEASAGG